VNKVKTSMVISLTLSVMLKSMPHRLNTTKI